MSENQIKIAAEEANIASKPIRVLCVDDETFNLDIMEKHLRKSGYETLRALDGIEAIDMLNDPSSNIDVVLLDRMMPNMDGMEVLKEMKKKKDLQDIPVIMQTAMAGSDDAVEGIKAGAYYYITKPYEASVLLSIVDSAVRSLSKQTSMQTRLDKADAVLNYAVSGEYQFNGMKEGRDIAAFLANFAKEPSNAIVALTALISNAIEHGNLEMGYDLKCELLLNDNYNQEFVRRSSSPEYSSRKVSVSFKKEDDVVKIYIQDEGNGFDWQQYMEFEPRRMTDPNGRGIALANSTNPGQIEYIGKGNVVCYTIYL